MIEQIPNSRDKSQKRTPVPLPRQNKPGTRQNAAKVLSPAVKTQQPMRQGSPSPTTDLNTNCVSDKPTTATEPNKPDQKESPSPTTGPNKKCVNDKPTTATEPNKPDQKESPSPTTEPNKRFFRYF